MSIVSVKNPGNVPPLTTCVSDVLKSEVFTRFSHFPLYGRLSLQDVAPSCQTQKGTATARKRE